MADLNAAIANLEAATAENETVDGSATVLLNTLFAAFEAAKNAPDQIQALVDKGRASTAALAAAVLANTPAAVPPTETPAARSKR